MYKNDYQKRVLNEKLDLDEKLLSLSHFTMSDTFITLDILERERLNTQKHLMTMYSGVLSDRILNFENVSK